MSVEAFKIETLLEPDQKLELRRLLSNGEVALIEFPTEEEARGFETAAESPSNKLDKSEWGSVAGVGIGFMLGNIPGAIIGGLAGKFGIRAAESRIKKAAHLVRKIARDCGGSIRARNEMSSNLSTVYVYTPEFDTKRNSSED